MNILVTGAWQNCQQYFPILREMGHCVQFLQMEADDLPCSSDWVEAVIGNGIFLHHPIREFRNLRYIQLTSAGTERVDMDYINTHGIKFFTAEDTYAVPMAEFTLAGVLQLYKGMRQFEAHQRDVKWKKIALF